MEIKVYTKMQEEGKYPSSELILNYCGQDYYHQLDLYNKFYAKISILLAFAGVLLGVLINQLELSIPFEKFESSNHIVGYLIILRGIFSCLSILLLIVVVVWQLLLLIGSKFIYFPLAKIQEESMYKDKKEDVALWMALKYIESTESIRSISEKKNRQFNILIKCMIASIVLALISKLLMGVI